MESAQSGEITHLLRRVRSGSVQERDRLLELIYPELLKLARISFKNERADHMLQPSALVNEAYLRLVAHRAHTWRNPSHFYGAAARLMRRILIDHARSQQALKRGGRGTAIQLARSEPLEDSQRDDLLALDEALKKLEAISPRQVRIIELRYFAGLSVGAAARALGMTSRTVNRDWALARAWLRRELRTLVKDGND
jgi:RNA polymerase sigma factor (TIGR02999 family)